MSNIPKPPLDRLDFVGKTYLSEAEVKQLLVWSLSFYGLKLIPGDIVFSSALGTAHITTRSTYTPAKLEADKPAIKSSDLKTPADGLDIS